MRAATHIEPGHEPATAPVGTPTDASRETTDAPTETTAKTERTWTIGQLAEEFETTLRTIRHYEDAGLLCPDRVGQQRIYHARDRVRLKLVMRGRRLGFSLDEIATIIDMYDAEPGEEGQLRYLIGQIADRRAELESRRRDLDEALRELSELQQRCQQDLAARLSAFTPE